MFKNKFYIPNSLIDDIILEYHDKRGHFGYKCTLEMLRKYFYFDRMSHRVQ